MRQPVWFACGDTGLLLDFSGYGPSLGASPLSAENRGGLTRKARQLGQMIKQRVDKGQAEGITDIVPGLCSVLIHYDPLIITSAAIKQQISLFLDQLDETSESPAPLWHLPVCYGGTFGPDLDEVAKRTNLSPEEVISRHTSCMLEVAIMGFLPGLGYMTGVDEALYLPRRSEPRTFVAQGSVGIAMDQTVIYPLDSPGGWNLIGKMPIPLFDQARDTPILFAAGDKVRFYPVGEDEFAELAASCADGHLPLSPVLSEEAV